MRWLVDTNIISESKNSRKSLAVMEWISQIPLDALFTSTVNIAELIYGAEKLENIQKRRDLDSWISMTVRPWFENRILEVDVNVLVRWRILTRMSDVAQNPAPATDLLIAAVAFENELAVATRDTKPFAACGIPTLNPWTGECFNGV
jgi:toxin FitB